MQNHDNWFGQQEYDPLGKLVAAHSNRRLIEFALFSRELAGYESAANSRDTIAKAYQSAKRLPPGALAAVFSEPEFHYWSYISHCLLRRLKNSEEIPIADTPHILGVANSALNPLSVHVQDINRFLLSASVLAGEEFEAEIPIHDGRIFLPGLGLMINVESGRPFSRIALSTGATKLMVDGAVIENSAEAVEVALHKKGQFSTRQIRVLPSIRRRSGSILLNGMDPYFLQPWVRSFRNPDGSSYGEVPETAYSEWEELLGRSLDKILECWPEMEADIASAVRVVVPVRCPLPSVHMSCSNEKMRFALLISDGSPLVVAEALIHELGHNVLNALAEEGEIFIGKPRMEEDLYSPWRPDARHLLGVLHAVFVFERVCEFYRRFLSQQENPSIRARYAEMTARILIAMDVIRPFENLFAAAGSGIVEGIKARTALHGVSSQSHRNQEDRGLLRGHYQRWEQQNGAALIPQGESVTKYLHV